MLFALAPLLLVAAFFAYHTLSKLHSSSSTTPPPAATTSATTVPTATPVSETTPAATTFTPIVTPAAAGKLTRLPSFSPKDPFHDQGPRTSVAAATQPQTGSKTKKTPAAPPTTAVIAVNGRLASVVVGAIFPVTKDAATNGVFRLVSLTAKAAKVAVVGGSYTSGKHALTLGVDSVVTLVNTADGKRYTLILYPQGTPVPGAPPTTTPATTTTGP